MSKAKHAPLPEIRLKVRMQGRRARYFKKQCARPGGSLPAGSMVFVRDREGRPVGTALYNPRSEITLRILDHGSKAAPQTLILDRLERALDFREEILGLRRGGTAYRLVHAEGDGLPGFVLDRCGEYLVAEISCKGMEAFLEEIGARLRRRYPKGRLVLRVDAKAADREGLECRPTPLDVEAELEENGIRYLFRPGGRHKTGFFCDQRENRLEFGRMASGRRVLDLCCHAGGFAMQAARGGARSVLAVDLDEEALALCRKNAARNGLRVSVRHADAFAFLKDCPKGAFDLAVLDPPKWVPDRTSWERGLRRYLDLNARAMTKVAKGGFLLSCSCSGAVDEETFLGILRRAAERAGRSFRILRCTGAGPDHPVDLACPETRYLKAVWLQARD